MLIAIIVALIWIIFIANKTSESLSDKKRKRLINEAETIKKTYPRAFKEYELKYQFFLLRSSKTSTLEDIVGRPSYLWENEENDLVEKENHKKKELYKKSLTTKVSDNEIINSIVDENSLRYSRDGFKVISNYSPYISTISIKDGTIVVCDNAFSDFYDELDCNYIEYIIIPQSVMKIGVNPFHGRVRKVVCKSPFFEVIDDILYDKNNTNKKLIQCFNRNNNNCCENNKRIAIPEGVRTIGERSFYDCELDSITIPSSVCTIEANPFVSINSLSHNPISIISNSDRFIVDNNALYDDNTNTLISYFGKETQFRIKEGTKIIGEFSFWEATCLESILIPESIEQVNGYELAFGGTWDSLKSIIIPSGQKNKYEKIFPKHKAFLHDPTDFFLKHISLKQDKDIIIKVLQSNGIQCFYHFTAKNNLSSIKALGGLYSWYSMQENKRNIPCSGGDDWSHQLDMRHGLQDYVRLSFCDDHPMAFRLKQSGTPLVLLKIDIEVATWKDTLFSDINAADNNHRHGGSLADLNHVNFNAVKRNYVSREDADFKPHQAEVMVKTFIPTKYILNLETPIAL
ncbi:MAG: DUF4433 domain-containing protein [Bacteroidales bacterium]|nr:DUF4433 domain-containing protein [Bacteroidales bacterium]